jgi:alkylation response protein AidB-like acyl-CoA dehydrogenase
MATGAVAAGARMTGGSFLIEERAPEEIFTPEDLSEDHRAIARTTAEFFKKEVEPHLEALQHGDHDLAVSILRKGAEIGLAAITTPERYGGMELDLVSALVVAEQIARDASYSGWHGAHAGIGTLPLLLFGTEEQKAKYLPKLSTAEMVAAYCLSEPHAGSDALAAKTRADLSPDGTHYILNGQKAWITNGGKADLFTVFAKINGEKFSAFLVERAFPGVSSGAEEKKMGIKGSSTTAVYLDNVHVPVENLLGEPGRGHIIAFNVLNLGRLKLGAATVSGSKMVLQLSLKYAKERKAFGSEIAQFGVIQHKLAEMAIRIFAAESMTYRVAGAIESRMEGFSWEAPNAAHDMMKAVVEFAVECAIVKVCGSEMLDYVVDEGVQIHGGYGFHQDYAVERAYRDSRVNRIFEGTNEINRLLITGMLLKRAQRGQLGLVKAAQGVMAEILSPTTSNGAASEERRLLANAKKIVLLLMGASYQKFLGELEKQQEVLASISDTVMEVYAMESTLLRTEKRKSEAMSQMTAVLLRDAMTRIEASARNVLAACAEGDALRTNMAVLRKFAKFEPVNAIALRRSIAGRLLDAGRYVA